VPNALGYIRSVRLAVEINFFFASPPFEHVPLQRSSVYAFEGPREPVERVISKNRLARVMASDKEHIRCVPFWIPPSVRERGSLISVETIDLAVKVQ